MFKNIVDLAEGLILNDQVTIDNWNLANSNADKSITLPENMKTVVNNIVKNLIKKNNEEIQTQKWEDEKAKIKPIEKEKRDKSEWYFNGQFTKRYAIWR